MQKKTFKIIEVPAAKTPGGGSLCFSYEEQDCEYFISNSGCKNGWPKCEDLGIIYLKVEDND